MARSIRDARPTLSIPLGRDARIRSWRRGDENALVRHANDRDISRWLRDRFPQLYAITDEDPPAEA